MGVSACHTRTLVRMSLAANIPWTLGRWCYALLMNESSQENRGENYLTLQKPKSIPPWFLEAGVSGMTWMWPIDSLDRRLCLLLFPLPNDVKSRLLNNRTSFSRSCRLWFQFMAFCCLGKTSILTKLVRNCSTNTITTFLLGHISPEHGCTLLTSLLEFIVTRSDEALASFIYPLPY